MGDIGLKCFTSKKSRIQALKGCADAQKVLQTQVFIQSCTQGKLESEAFFLRKVRITCRHFSDFLCYGMVLCDTDSGGGKGKTHRNVSIHGSLHSISCQLLEGSLICCYSETKLHVLFCHACLEEKNWEASSKETKPCCEFCCEFSCIFLTKAG